MKRAKGEFRFPYTDQRRMVTGILGICLFAFIVTGIIDIFPVANWIKAGTINPVGPMIASAALGALRFTVYRKKLVEGNNQYS
jgi:hypothetical protein